MINSPYKIKILHLEDLSSDAELVEYQLRKGGILFEKLVVDNKTDFENALNEFLPDIVLSDHALLNFDSVRALKMLKNSGLPVPFILVTATVSEEFAVEIMKQGACDYILKDRMERLPVAVLGALEKCRLEREEKEANEKINRANRLYSFISQVNQNIVHLKDKGALFYNSCRLAHDFGKFEMAWIGMFNNEKTHISLVEQRGVPTEIIQRFTNGFCQKDGPQDHVLRTGTYYICNDIQNAPELKNWHFFAKSYNINSCMVLPIKRSGNIIGTFNLYAKEINFSSEEEIALLVEVTGDISFALDMFEKAEIQKETQELILKNEKRFRLLIEKSTDMKTLSNREGEFIYHSPSLTKTLGYSKEELLGMSILDLIHPDDMLEYAKSRNAILQSPGKSLYFEQRRRHKNNGWVWCEGSLTNLLHEPGIHALVSNFKDISDKKKLEQQREFDETNFFALINNTYDLMWSVDMDFKLITSNAPFDSINKLMSGSAIAKGETVLSASYSPEKLNRFKARYERAFAGEAFTEIEYNSVPFEFWSEISYYPIRKDNAIIGTACYSRDITERKRAAKILEQSEASLKEAQAIAHLGNWKVDFASNMAEWSEEACRIYGLPPEENKQTLNAWLTFIHPEDMDYVVEATVRAQKTLSDMAVNYRAVLKDGTIKYIYSKSRFEFDKDGKPSGLYGIVHDITEIKEAERQLIKSEAFNRGVLNSLKSHISVIDGSGTVVAVNDSWRSFALENGEDTLQRTGVGSNYYEACDASVKAGDSTAVYALDGIKKVMDGKLPVFYLEYPCHSPSRQRWFAMRAMKFDSDERLVVVAHMDISELKITQEELTNTLLELEDRVKTRTQELVDRNKSILDSINYAKRIQVGLLCRPTQLTEIFPKSFILFQPLDIVSGDFFWCYQKRNKKFIVLADCTGHGVPGALMSIIGNNLLTHIIIDEHIENPSEILELLDIRLAESVKGDTQEVKDGMDITLCVVDTHFNELYFAGAHTPLFISNENGEIHELAASRHAIGGGIQEIGKKFETRRLPFAPGQYIYLSSDGFYSQFGGPKGKKFMKSRFKKTLEEFHGRQMDEQKKLLMDALTTWTGNNEQVDDIMVIGIEL